MAARAGVAYRRGTAAPAGPSVVSGTLAGAAPPWMETWLPVAHASDLKLARFPSGARPALEGDIEDVFARPKGDYLAGWRR